MKRLLSTMVALVAAIAFSVLLPLAAVAQNIPYSPSSPVGNHLNTVPNATPALSSCGTSPAISGDDKGGQVTLGTGSPAGCTITFFQAYNSAPYCVVSWQANIASMQYVVTAASITLTQTGTSSDKVNYHCFGQAGG